MQKDAPGQLARQSISSPLVPFSSEMLRSQHLLLKGQFSNYSICLPTIDLLSPEQPVLIALCVRSGYYFLTRLSCHDLGHLPWTFLDPDKFGAVLHMEKNKTVAETLSGEMLQVSRFPPVLRFYFQRLFFF